MFLRIEKERDMRRKIFPCRIGLLLISSNRNNPKRGVRKEKDWMPAGIMIIY
jgi:hypothetical protein